MSEYETRQFFNLTDIKPNNESDWECAYDNKNTPHLHGKTFRVKVASIDENNCYVYAPYGQDIVPIKQAKLISKEQPKQVESDNPRYPLFKHLSNEHNLILVDSELDEIIKISNEIFKNR